MTFARPRFAWSLSLRSVAGGLWKRYPSGEPSGGLYRRNGAAHRSCSPELLTGGAPELLTHRSCSPELLTDPPLKFSGLLVWFHQKGKERKGVDRTSDIPLSRTTPTSPQTPDIPSYPGHPLIPWTSPHTPDITSYPRNPLIPRTSPHTPDSALTFPTKSAWLILPSVLTSTKLKNSSAFFTTFGSSSNSKPGYKNISVHYI